ncbi:MAG: glycerate kinase [Propionibacteriaceae bacterium]
MRVVVTSSGIDALSPGHAGEALATAWLEAVNAECAVIPMGGAGDGFIEAFCDLHSSQMTQIVVEQTVQRCWATADGVTIVVALENNPLVGGIPTASSTALGAAVAKALEQWPGRSRLVVDLSWASETHDAGAGMLAALGAHADVPLDQGLAGLHGCSSVDISEVAKKLAGMEIVGLVGAKDHEQHLLGLRGISAGRGHEAQIDLPTTIAADRAIEAFARAIAPKMADQEGAGACGGAGFAVLALGGRLATGAELIAGDLNLVNTVAKADLVVVGCDHFDFYTRGGDSVGYVARVAAESAVPVIVIAQKVVMAQREQRLLGIEAAYALELPHVCVEKVVTSVQGIATSWCW